MKDYIQLRKFPVKDMLKTLLQQTAMPITGSTLQRTAISPKRKFSVLPNVKYSPVSARLLNSRLSERKIKPKFSHPPGYATE